MNLGQPSRRDVWSEYLVGLIIARRGRLEGVILINFRSVCSCLVTSLLINLLLFYTGSDSIAMATKIQSRIYMPAVISSFSQP